MKSNAGKDFNTKLIIDWESWVFFFSHLINYLKSLTDLGFLISPVKLFHSFMQYGKKVFLQDLVLHKEGLIAEAEGLIRDLKESFIWEGKPKYKKR